MDEECYFTYDRNLKTFVSADEDVSGVVYTYNQETGTFQVKIIQRNNSQPINPIISTQQPVQTANSSTPLVQPVTQQAPENVSPITQQQTNSERNSNLSNRNQPPQPEEPLDSLYDGEQIFEQTVGLALFNNFKQLRDRNKKIVKDSTRKRKRPFCDETDNLTNIQDDHDFGAGRSNESIENDNETEVNAEENIDLNEETTRTTNKKRLRKGKGTEKRSSKSVMIDYRDLSCFKPIMTDILHGENPLPLPSMARQRLFCAVHEFLHIQGIDDYKSPGASPSTLFIALTAVYPKLFDDKNYGYGYYSKSFLEWRSNGRRKLSRRSILEHEETVITDNIIE